MGILYLVSTPIGNLEDITLRAIRLLGEVDLIACEDTRKAGLLLKGIGIGKKELFSFFEGNEEKRIPQLISFLKEGKKIALITNAGTPLISDPGFKLVRECVRQGIKVESVPGASAVLAALTCSGLPTDKFLFLGYLPKKSGKRLKILQNLAARPQFMTTTVVYLSPHRLVKELESIKEVFGEIEIVLCRELTKVYEEIRREKISDSLNHFTKTKPKGEFTLVFKLG